MDKIQEIQSRQLPFAQKSVEWLSARHNLLTSSDVASALDCNIHESSLELLKRKCMLIGDLPLENGKSIEWGETYEDVAFDIFSKMTNKKVVKIGLVKHKTYDWLAASPDGGVEDGFLLEIKCPSHRVLMPELIPYYYWIQIQIQMEVCDVDKAYFFQCRFVEHNQLPATSSTDYCGQHANGKYWVLQQHTLKVFDRDRDWFAKNLDRLSNFWDKVKYYRQFGMNKLVADIGHKQTYYNTNTNEVVYIDETDMNKKKNTKKTKKRKVIVIDDESNGKDEIITSNVSNINDISNGSNTTNTNDMSYLSPKINPLPMAPPINWFEWVAATDTKNYILNDTLIDWLNVYGKDTRSSKRRKTGNDSYDVTMDNYEDDAKTSAPFFHYLQTRGITFEDTVVTALYKKFPKHIITVANSFQVRQQDKFLETVKYMTDGVPIIYQAILHNSQNKTYGISDLLVRSDWINKIFTTPAITSYEAAKGCKFNDSWHYRVIDIKHSTLTLCADGVHLLNSGLMPAYKAQLCVYNDALSQIQNYKPNNAYLLGKRWVYRTCGDKFEGDNCFDRAGVVDFDTVDSDYPTKTQQAVDWIREVRTDGLNWSINPPSRDELYPNMSNTNDTPWHSTKEIMADKLGEITQVWYCGHKERKIAFSKGVKSWKDPKCTAALMNINGGKIAPVVNAILNINRSTTDVIRTKPINIKLPRAKVEFFVDFETINDIIEYNGMSRTYLFMIGVGWRANDGKPAKWTYECFTTPLVNYEDDSELNNFIDFHDYIMEILDQYDARDNFMIYHWSTAERVIYDNVAERYFEHVLEYYNDCKFEWMDLLDVFKSEPIVVKGAFDFSLKSIAKAMHSHGFIKTSWPQDGIIDGLNAMVKAIECSDEAKRKEIDMVELPIMKKIMEYNEVDCKVLMEILSYVRHNLTKKGK